MLGKIHPKEGLVRHHTPSRLLAPIMDIFHHFRCFYIPPPVDTFMHFRRGTERPLMHSIRAGLPRTLSFALGRRAETPGIHNVQCELVHTTSYCEQGLQSIGLSTLSQATGATRTTAGRGQREFMPRRNGLPCSRGGVLRPPLLSSAFLPRVFSCTNSWI